MVASLEGLVVLDLSHRDDPGAYCTMVLADFGADVIKVDPPARRAGGPVPRDDWPIAASAAKLPEERLAAFLSFDRNKRSVELDLQNDGDRAMFLRLVRRADVVVEDEGPGVMDRLGLGHAVLSAANPGLIYCAISRFGRNGPYAGMAAHDLNALALSGALSLIGPRGGAPVLPGRFIPAIAAAGNHAIIGILLALTARQTTGRGQLVDIAVLDSVMMLMNYDHFEHLISGYVPKRGETMLTGQSPWAQALRCKDGKYIVLGAGEPVFWRNLCAGLGREDLLPFRDPSDPARAEKAIAELAAIFATRTRDEWFAYFLDRNTAVTPVYELDEVFRDPHVLHREMLVELDHPSLGTIKQAGIAIKLSDTPGRIRFLGVPTGSDTKAVLEALEADEASHQTGRPNGAAGC